MASFKIYYKAADKDVKVLRATDTAPGGGYTLIATIDHATTDSDVIYHHVRDALYAQGVQSMQANAISVFNEVSGIIVPEVGCIYSLNGDATAIGENQAVVSGADMQTASFTMVAPGANHYLTAVPPGIFPDYPVVDFTTGKRQFGIAFNVPASAGTITDGFAAYNASAGFFYVDDGFVGISLTVTHVGTPTGNKFMVTVNGETDCVGSPFSTCPESGYVVADGVAGTFRVWLDFGAGPVEHTPVVNTFTANAAMFGIIFVTQFTGMPAADEGKTIGSTLITSAAALPSLVAGAVDICGNAISGTPPI